MEFVVLGKYTPAGLTGFAKNPAEDGEGRRKNERALADARRV